MKLIQLSNERTKTLENETQQFINLLVANEYDEIRILLKDILRWYSIHEFKNNSFYNKTHKLTELFNTKPNYYVNYSSRNAVWGFEWEDTEFIFYQSKEGLSIQFLESFPKQKLKQFFIELKDLLYFKKF